MSAYSYIAAGSTNQDSQNVKVGSGWLGAIVLHNTSAAVRYVKLYDKATAPTSADTPILRFFIPAGGTTEAAWNTQEVEAAFGKGLGHRITTGIADNDANAATANDVIVNLIYR